MRVDQIKSNDEIQRMSIPLIKYLYGASSFKIEKFDELVWIHKKKNIIYNWQKLYCFQITVDLHTPQYFGHTLRVLQDLQDGRRKSEHSLLL